MSAKSNPSKAQLWQAHFAAWKSSGLSQAEYCKQHDLKLSNFTYWRSRVNKPQRKFMPISAPAGTDRLVMSLPCGIRLELTAQTLPAVLPTVLRALQDAR